MVASKFNLSFLYCSETHCRHLDVVIVYIWWLVSESGSGFGELGTIELWHSKIKSDSQQESNKYLQTTDCQSFISSLYLFCACFSLFTMLKRKPTTKKMSSDTILGISPPLYKDGVMLWRIKPQNKPNIKQNESSEQTKRIIQPQ